MLKEVTELHLAEETPRCVGTRVIEGKGQSEHGFQRSRSEAS